jgi:hypothetical protein
MKYLLVAFIAFGALFNVSAQAIPVSPASVQTQQAVTTAGAVEKVWWYGGGWGYRPYWSGWGYRPYWGGWGYRPYWGGGGCGCGGCYRPCWRPCGYYGWGCGVRWWPGYGGGWGPY